MKPFGRATHHLRAAASLGATRPAYAAGLRAAVATMVPVIAGASLPGEAATWMSLAGFNGALNDRGGSYRTRAVTMGVLTVTAAIGVGLGALVHGRVVAAIAVTFVVAIVCALARVWGSAGAGIGGAVLCSYLISLAVPPNDLGEALHRGGFAIVGGVWAMLIALVLWPLRPYRPVRLAVAACYRAVADFADNLAARAQRGESADAWALLQPTVAVRKAVEDARIVLASTRLGRPGETERGERLLVLHEAAEQLFVHLVALGDTVESVGSARREPVVEVVLAATLADLSLSARRIADAIEAERGSQTLSIGWNGTGVRTAAAEPVHSPSDEHYDHAARLLDRMAQYAEVAAENAESLNGGAPAHVDETLLERRQLERRRSLGELFGQILSPGSLLVRHALRLATLVAAAIWLSAVFGLKRNYWITITIVIILQPYTGATTQKALQRVAGTVLGAMITAGLAALFHDSHAMMVLIVVFVAACVALLPLNYAAYSIFLTPAFVLLAEAGANDWHLAGLRVTNTLIGGAMALVGAWLLWPTSAWRDLPALAAAALRANRKYVVLAASAVAGDAEASRALAQARREVASAAGNLEESFERLLGEHRGPAIALKPIMTLMTYTRRFAFSVGALALGSDERMRPPRDALRPFADAAARVLDDLADAITEGRAPDAFPQPGEVARADAMLAPLVSARVERLARQLKPLHDAVAEITAADAPAAMMVAASATR
ncbi:MAG: FUSC family protein [Gemmatimonadaceae bacterium]